jgi:hypothetical protein
LKGKKDIKFTCYEYLWNEGVGTMFLFYPGGDWDEDKMTLSESLKKYPVDKYEWIHFDH